jgi:hydrogenase maturation protease
MTPSESDRRRIRDKAVLRDTLVLALGNPLRGDDGAGPAIVDLLAGNLPSYVVVEDGGTPGLTTVLLMHGYRRVIIVDAADMGLEAGQWRRFGADALSAGDLHQIGTLHDAGLAEALELGRALGVLPADIVIYGIQPAAIGWEVGLSEAVKQAVQSVAHEIAGEVS